LRILEDSRYKHPVVFHWYSGSLADLDDIIARGHYFSVNPAMVVSPNGKKIIERIPPDKVLTESDGPFVKLQGKAVEPKSVIEVEKYLASLWSEETDKVRMTIRENFLELVSPLRNVIKSGN
jgi:TatD DNase family protein